MDYRKISWFNKESQKWNIDYSSHFRNEAMFFATEEGSQKLKYFCSKKLGKEMHSIFERLFSSILVTPINIANMSLLLPEDYQKGHDYIHGEFDIIYPNEDS